MVGTVSALYAVLPTDLVNQYAGGVDVSSALSSTENIAGLLEQNNAAFETMKTGIDQVQAGSADVYDGASVLREQYQLFHEQIQKLPVILENMISEKMTVLKQAIDQLVTEYGAFHQGVAEYTQGVQTVSNEYDVLYDALLQVTEGVASLTEGADELAEGNSSLFAGSQKLYDGTKDLKKGTDQLASGGARLASGAGSAVKGASSLSNGSLSLKDGSDQLKDGAVELYDGAGELYDGASELKDGTAELLEGTNEFSEKTEDIEEQVRGEIDKAVDEIAGGDYEPVSFVSEKNSNVELVQFVMQTGTISMEEEEEEVIEEESESVMDKLKDLFR